MATIHSVVDQRRGCGERKPGGLYLVTDPGGHPCGLFPIPLTRCPTCDAGIKQTRGWTWFNPKPFLDERLCRWADCDTCELSPSNRVELSDREGLLWIGKQFYPHPHDFLAEVKAQGLSRKIKAVPRGFVLGESWVFFAHLNALHELDTKTMQDVFTPGIIYAAVPRRIEYVVEGSEDEEKLETMEERGIRLIRTRVIPGQEELQL